MELPEDKTWFSPANKRSLPNTWQGWLVVIAYFVLLIGGFIFLHSKNENGWYAYAIFLTVLLNLVFWFKRARSRWRGLKW
jgi:hypothetical protein